jgi:Transposase
MSCSGSAEIDLYGGLKMLHLSPRGGVPAPRRKGNGDEGQEARQLPVEEKLKILKEARQPNTTVAEVLRRHQLDAATFYRWEREAKGRGP